MAWERFVKVNLSYILRPTRQKACVFQSSMFRDLPEKLMPMPTTGLPADQAAR
ncbi:MAG: hypothetical protein RLY31_419 [Bacteroidota bacterium]